MYTGCMFSRRNDRHQAYSGVLKLNSSGRDRHSTVSEAIRNRTPHRPSSSFQLRPGSSSDSAQSTEGRRSKEIVAVHDSHRYALEVCLAERLPKCSPIQDIRIPSTPDSKGSQECRRTLCGTWNWSLQESHERNRVSPLPSHHPFYYARHYTTQNIMYYMLPESQ